MIYSIDWTIAAVALPHMQGTFSTTQDQIAWVMTSYIVVSAIVLPTTGWLSNAGGLAAGLPAGQAEGVNRYP